MIVNRLVRLLNEKGISTNKMLLDCGLSASIVDNWKKGKSKPTSEALIKIADYFDVSIDYLLGRETTQFSILNEILEKDQQELLGMYVLLSDKNKKWIFTQLERLSEKEDEERNEALLKVFDFNRQACIKAEKEGKDFYINFEGEQCNVANSPYMNKSKPRPLNKKELKSLFFYKEIEQANKTKEPK